MLAPPSPPARRTDGDGLTPFEAAVDTVLAALPAGDVVTYGEVAIEAGFSPRASRAVGALLARCGGQYPWWRVVTAAGRLVPGHEVEHARLLRAEGVEVVGGRVPVPKRKRRGHTGPPPSPSQEQP